MRLLLWLVALLLPFSQAQTDQQTIRIGVVVSQTGAARQSGQAQVSAVKVLAAKNRSGILNFEVLVRDDGSSAVTAAQQVQELVETDEVHAVICCTTAAATEGIADYVERSRVLTLSLSEVASPNFWLFTVKPDTQRLLKSVILNRARAGETRFSLMTLDNSLGDEVVGAVEQLLSPDSGVLLVAERRYPPNVSVLTPEALWVATRLPDTVIAWGLPGDSKVAYEGLRDRGFEKEVVLNPGLLEPGARTNLEALSGSLFPVAPAQVASSLPMSHSLYETVTTFERDMATRYGPGRTPVAGAYAYDAFNLIKAAVEQSYTYGVPTDDLTTFRGVLRDAFVGMGLRAGATAKFDYSENDHVGVKADSLVLAKLTRGRLEVE